jgi:hypothetical protein
LSRAESKVILKRILGGLCNNLFFSLLHIIHPWSNIIQTLHYSILLLKPRYSRPKVLKFVRFAQNLECTLFRVIVRSRTWCYSVIIAFPIYNILSIILQLERRLHPFPMWLTPKSLCYLGCTVRFSCSNYTGSKDARRLLFFVVAIFYLQVGPWARLRPFFLLLDQSNFFGWLMRRLPLHDGTSYFFIDLYLVIARSSCVSSNTG